jgi:hypothetical protein
MEDITKWLNAHPNLSYEEQIAGLRKAEAELQKEPKSIGHWGLYGTD